MLCTACEKEHKKTEVLYTEDKKPYCANPFTCNDLHPNSVKNIIERNGAVKMFTEEELDQNIFETMGVSDEMKERVIKLVAKPQSIRLSKYDIALYLLQLQATRNVESIGEAVRHCIQVAMQYEPMEGDLRYDIPELEESPEPEIIEKRKGVKVVTSKPSINVDWDEIDRQRAAEQEQKDTEPEIEEPAEEDEFSF